MHINESTTDRVIRAVVGVALVVAAFFVESNVLTVILGLLAAVAFFTAAVGFCPLYRLVGMSTAADSSTEVSSPSGPESPASRS